MSVKIPEGLEYWTADEIAECLSVSNATSQKLWDISSICELSDRIEMEWAEYKGERWVGYLDDTRRMSKPRGGDGSNGTTEIPIVDDSYADQPRKFWKKLTLEQQSEIAWAYITHTTGSTPYTYRNPNRD